MNHHARSIRRTLVVLMLSAATPAIAQTTNRAAPSAQTRPTTEIDSSAVASRAAIDSGLAFLASQQNVDGSFQPAGAKLQTSAVALLAFLSAGNIPDSGRYGDAVRRVTEYLLRQTPGDRYFGRVDGSRLRGQAIVTLALCEVYGVESDEPTRIRLHATVKDAAAFILASQNARPGASGGWGADPGAAASDPAAFDPAVTQWCLLALHAAQQIGLTVPQANLDRAIDAVQQRSLPQTAPSPASAPTSPSASASPSPDSLLYHLYRNTGDTAFFHSPSWTSASRALLATQAPSGAWSAADQAPGVASTAETAMNLFVLAAEDQVLPIWMK